jgi:hydroxymethylpyrimidine/phosphomethylpyrimidine kinase
MSAAPRPQGRVLIVAGSDSGGGAGIQADIKTVTALGGYAATAITALTAQDTVTVHAVHAVPPDFVARQMRVVLDDLGADCIKTGMLHAKEVVEAVVGALPAGVPLVVDPVTVAKGGASLLAADAVATIKGALVPRATLVTPNVPEAMALTGRSIAGRGDAVEAGKALLAMGAGAALVKGGHLAGGEVEDILVSREGVEILTGPRLKTRHTHGTGCTLASAVATGLAQGLTLRGAVARARDYVLQAIMTAPGFGKGHGPLNHGHTVRPFGIR